MISGSVACKLFVPERSACEGFRRPLAKALFFIFSDIGGHLHEVVGCPLFGTRGIRSLEFERSFEQLSHELVLRFRFLGFGALPVQRDAGAVERPACFAGQAVAGRFFLNR